MQFQLISPFQMSPGQEEAVNQLVANFPFRGYKVQPRRGGAARGPAIGELPDHLLCGVDASFCLRGFAPWARAATIPPRSEHDSPEHPAAWLGREGIRPSSPETHCNSPARRDWPSG